MTSLLNQLLLNPPRAYLASVSHQKLTADKIWEKTVIQYKRCTPPQFTAKDLAKGADMNHTSANRVCRKLLEKGKIEKVTLVKTGGTGPMSMLYKWRI